MNTILFLLFIIVKLLNLALASALPSISTEQSETICKCIGVTLNNICYSSLTEAISHSNDGDTIFVGHDLTIQNPISFTQSLAFMGVQCTPGIRPYFIAQFDSPVRAILEAIHPVMQTINMANLGFTSSAGLRAAAFHSLGNETNAGEQRIKMSLSNVRMSHMQSERPGVAIFIGSSVGLEIDENCTFDNLLMSTNTPDLYAGGAAIAVIYLNRKFNMAIEGTFFNNVAEYPMGSKHSSGGSIYLDYMEGAVVIDGKFKGNSANQGGAIHVQEVFGSFLFNGTYIENKSVDADYGSRGGAIRILALRSTANCIIDGFYSNNVAEGRGGILATNIHNRGGILIIKGTYTNNTATDSGGIWGFWSGNTSLNGTGTIIFDGTTIFQGNQALRKPETSIFYINDKANSATLSESQWNEYGQTIQIN